MRALRYVVIGLLIVLGAGTAFADSHGGKLMKEVQKIGDELTKAMLNSDFDAMLAYYAEDAISLPNYGPRMQGIQAFREHHAQMTASGMKIKSFTSDPTEVWKAGDHVIEIGNFTIELDMPGMPGVKDNGKYMTVYVRGSDGKLKIKAETWNTDTNPMAMAGGHGHEHPTEHPTEHPKEHPTEHPKKKKN